MATESKPRNRSTEAAAAGRRMVAFEITPEADRLINLTVVYLATTTGRANRVQALEWLIRMGAKKVPT